MYYVPLSGSLWLCAKLTTACSAHTALEPNCYCCSSQELQAWAADLLQQVLYCALFNLLNHHKNTAFTNLLKLPSVFQHLYKIVMQVLKKIKNTDEKTDWLCPSMRVCQYFCFKSQTFNSCVWVAGMLLNVQMKLLPLPSEQKLEILLVFTQFLPLQLIISLPLTSIVLYGFVFHTAKEFLTILHTRSHKIPMLASGFPYSMNLLSNSPLYLDCNHFNSQYYGFLHWFPTETNFPYTINASPQ